LLSQKTSKIKSLEYENYTLTKENSWLRNEFRQMESILEKRQKDIQKLLDILYGVDKVDEYKKLDIEALKEKQIRGYHIGPSKEVLKALYNNERVIKYHLIEDKNEKVNQFWSDSEISKRIPKKEIKENDSMMNLAMTGLWILKGSPSQRELANNMTISDQLKLKYNTMKQENLAFDRTNASEEGMTKDIRQKRQRNVPKP
jgi:hypothetical protein